MDKINIKKVAVIGSGIMGSRIACHLSNIGLSVILLDICPTELNEKEKKLNKTLKDKSVRNRIVNDSLLNSHYIILIFYIIYKFYYKDIFIIENTLVS